VASPKVIAQIAQIAQLVTAVGRVGQDHVTKAGWGRSAGVEQLLESPKELRKPQGWPNGCAEEKPVRAEGATPATGVVVVYVHEG